MQSSPPPHDDTPAQGGASVAIGFVTGMLSGMRARGIDPSALLQSAGIAPAVCADPRARVPLHAYARLYRLTAEALADEAFGLFPAPMRPGAFEFLCRGIHASPTLDVALERAARYLAIVLPELNLALRRDGSQATLRLSERARPWPTADDPRRIFAFEWLLRLVHGLSCWLVARSLPLGSVAFPYPRPAHAEDYALIYTANSSFEPAGVGAALEAHLQANLLDLPIRRDQSALEAFLQNGAENLTMLYRRDRETVRQVRDALAARLQQSPSLEDVAAHLHLSPRTLHRRLEQEGSSFRAIKDALRRDIALSRLERENVSIGRLAHELGYDDSSAFFRAFRKWTGVAPRVYRGRIR